MPRNPLDYERPTQRKNATIPFLLGVIAIIIACMVVMWHFDLWPILRYFKIAD